MITGASFIPVMSLQATFGATCQAGLVMAPEGMASEVEDLLVDILEVTDLPADTLEVTDLAADMVAEEAGAIDNNSIAPTGLAKAIMQT